MNILYTDTQWGYVKVYFLQGSQRISLYEGYVLLAL